MLSKIILRLVIVASALLALSGCIAPVPLQNGAPTEADSASQTSGDDALNTLAELKAELQQLRNPSPTTASGLDALEELTDLKEELKRLRNALEEIEFHYDTASRRQQNLFHDLDRRLISLESTQRLLLTSPGAIGGFALPVNDAPVTGDATVNGEVTDDIDDGANLITGGDEVADALTGNTDTSVDTVTVVAPATTPALVAETEAAGGVTLPQQDAYEAAFNLLKQSKYQDAIAGFQQLADTWPDSELADDAYYWMSEARYVNREFEAALSGFRTVVSRYPASTRVPEALLKIGYIQYDIGAYEEAADIFRDLLARFPGHQVSVSAQTRLRRIEQTIQP